MSRIAVVVDSTADLDEQQREQRADRDRELGNIGGDGKREHDTIEGATTEARCGRHRLRLR